VFNDHGAFSAAQITAPICVCVRAGKLRRQNCPAAMWQLPILFAFVISTTGCGTTNGGATRLQGQVTLNGKPLPADAKAFVTFVPEGNPGKAVSVPVTNGNYDSPDTPVGKVNVQFEISREVGPTKTSERTGQSYREMENLVPGKYSTGLPLEVTGDNSTQNFDLTK
jgi:hypothetical protein